jgi:hypothetical protein
MYREAVAAVVRDKRPTTSYVQRVLRIGYNRAASMIERMEREGIISSADHAGKRQISPATNAAAAQATKKRRNAKQLRTKHKPRFQSGGGVFLFRDPSFIWPAGPDPHLSAP